MITIKLDLSQNNFQEDVLTLDTNMTVKQANVFRRILLSQIEVVAVDLIRVYTNDTILCDEVLASRIGLIPVKYNEEIANKNDCACESFCFKCAIIVNYEHSGKEDGYIFSHDISPLFKENIPVAKMRKNQRLKFTLLLSKSTSHEHNKWSPRVPFEFRKKGENFIITLTNQGNTSFSVIMSQLFPIFASKIKEEIKIF